MNIKYLVSLLALVLCNVSNATTQRSITDYMDVQQPPPPLGTSANPIPVEDSSDEERSLSSREPKRRRIETVNEPIRPPRETEQVSILRGNDAHVAAYCDLIESAENSIIIAGWELKYIHQDIFKSLMKAKREGVYISLLINKIGSHRTLSYFDDSNDSSDEPRFSIAETKTHSKFLFVDDQNLVIGSYNALASGKDESNDTSLIIQGTASQLWPYQMRIRDTYTDLDAEETACIFSGISALSSAKYGTRNSLKHSLSCGTDIHMFWTVEHHEHFFREIIQSANKITVYSPFMSDGNAKKRLELLNEKLRSTARFKLKVDPKFRTKIQRLADKYPSLKQKLSVQPEYGHQKVFIANDDIICIGSMNWLSAAQEKTDDYGNTEISLALCGPLAASFIKDTYPEHLIVFKF